MTKPQHSSKRAENARSSAEPSERSGLGVLFSQFATRASWQSGSPWAFLAAVAVVVIWAITGPAYGYSDTWQLIANTVTNIATFLMVFLIQDSQNRDSKAINLKLGELIRAVQTAHNDMISIEELSNHELELLAKRYERFRKEYEHRREERKPAA